MDYQLSGRMSPCLPHQPINSSLVQFYNNALISVKHDHTPYSRAFKLRSRTHGDDALEFGIHRPEITGPVGKVDDDQKFWCSRRLTDERDQLNVCIYRTKVAYSQRGLGFAQTYQPAMQG